MTVRQKVGWEPRYPYPADDFSQESPESYGRRQYEALVDESRVLRRAINQLNDDLTDISVIAGASSGAPVDATYVTLSNNATLTAERVLTAGSNITLTDSGANGTITVAASPMSLTWWYGTGEDGAATLDGTNTYSFMSKSGSVYTLTRNVMLSALTVNVGSTLHVAGYAIYCSGAVTLNGTLGARGNDGVDHLTAGAATGANCYGGGSAGYTTNASTYANSIGGAGGGGGASNENPARSAGAVTLPAEADGGIGVLGSIYSTSTGRSFDLLLLKGGNGGAGGADNTAAPTGGGSGAGGGGIVPLFAASCAGSGTLTAAGGTGAAGTSNCGGGGGGGGGAILIITGTSNFDTLWTVTVAGGAAGAGHGAGSAGTAGSAGRVVKWIMKTI